MSHNIHRHLVWIDSVVQIFNSVIQTFDFGLLIFNVVFRLNKNQMHMFLAENIRISSNFTQNSICHLNMVFRAKVVAAAMQNG